MNEENTHHLFSTYPLLYRHHDRESLSNLMRFEFSCGDGWFRIVDEFSAKAEQIIAQMAQSGTPVRNLPSAMQVKEKFGRLRIQIANGQNTGIGELVVMAEQRAAETCMRCGAPGLLRQTGYWVTLCDSCHTQE
jgi:hypothetical protein